MLIFSETLAVAAEVMTGDSFTFNTVIATLFSAYNAPSEARTTILYTLSPFASVGTSKFGEALKVTIPLDEPMSNNVASAPPEIE